VRPDHVHAALAAASSGPVAQGNVGGGTGMICHEFKGGIGTGSRVVETAIGRFVVGVLVQANYGIRPRLAIDGVPVGRELGFDRVPAPPDDDVEQGAGSIIGVVATDAPLLPLACQRLAQRAGLGMARVGGAGSDSSGDLFLAFATGNRGLGGLADVHEVRSIPNDWLTPFFYATIEATEEAIVNALLSAETMTGRLGTVYALPHDDLVEIWRRHRPGS
jgi:D-aminopeptidase